MCTYFEKQQLKQVSFLRADIYFDVYLFWKTAA